MPHLRVTRKVFDQVILNIYFYYNTHTEYLFSLQHKQLHYEAKQTVLQPAPAGKVLAYFTDMFFIFKCIVTIL